MRLTCVWPFVLAILFSESDALIIRIPEQYPTIQQGLNRISAGDTISVAIGVYTEALIAPPIAFNMIGELGADSSGTVSPLIDATGIGQHDTIAAISLPSQSVALIANFRIKNSQRRGVQSLSESIELRNCVVDSVREGFRFLDGQGGGDIRLELCQFRQNDLFCVLVPLGNMLYARGCLFSGSNAHWYTLVLAGQATIEFCRFESSSQRVLLALVEGDQRVNGNYFGQVETPLFERAVSVSGGRIEFSRNTMSEIVYGYRSVMLQSNTGDSVLVGENTFQRCNAHSGVQMAQGILGIDIQGEHNILGAFVSSNRFVECSGYTACDDISISQVAPALISHNRFVRDSVNGLPSVFAGNPVWQQTPVTLRDNVWEDCGYAVELSTAADARFNYWGHPSGPYHEIDNPLGLGDTITGPVPFIPWLEDTIEAVEQPRVELVNELSVQIYPNPFNSTVTIEYALIREQDVTLEIYDVLGRQVETLLNERQGVGVHSVKWNADNFASGLYFAKLSTPTNASQAVKLLLMK